MQIVARKLEYPTPLFNFCSRTLSLVTREAELRKKIRPGDNSHRAAQLADDVLQLVRARHRHVGHCPTCLVAEVLFR
jgi:hypothetical protein